MAFNVTPTSGVGPYTFSADFLDKGSFGYGYSLRLFRSAQVSGSCPPPELASTPMLDIAQSLLNNGVGVYDYSLGANSCSTFRLDIVNDLGDVVDTQNVNISNV